MIRPHLDYIDFVVDSGSADRIKRLDSLQKKALRRIEYCINVENRQDKDVFTTLWQCCVMTIKQPPGGTILFER